LQATYTLNAVVCACIDIGSNTTRLRVAEPDRRQLWKLLRQHALIAIGIATRWGVQ
jgi:exopolyphosphatase/pppGpp-phosphohydrolase